jgi:hypothetical protein
MRRYPPVTASARITFEADACLLVVVVVPAACFARIASTKLAILRAPVHVRGCPLNPLRAGRNRSAPSLIGNVDDAARGEGHVGQLR